MIPSRILRMLETVAILRSGRNNLVQDLAGFHGVSRRTIFRDLRDLRDAGMECRYNPKTGSYGVDEDIYLPSVNMNSMEAATILLLAYKAAVYLQLPFSETCVSATAKLESQLPTKVRQFCQTYLQNVSFGVRSQEKTCFSKEMFWRLLDATQEKRVASIYYCPPSEAEGIMTELKPYHLFYDEPTWYVVGNSSFHGNVHSFGLSYIRKLDVLDRFFTEHFDAKEYIGKAWSMLPSDTAWNVRLRFSPHVARDVSETLWHSTQRVSFQKDGSAVVEFRISGFREIIWWILSYGNRVQVLEPEVLRRQIIAIAKNVVRLHK